MHPHNKLIDYFIKNILWNGGNIKGHDIFINLPCGLFKCHKIVIASHSQLLKEVMDGEKNVRMIDLGDNEKFGYVTPLLFSKMLQYFYTGVLNFSFDMDSILKLCDDLKATYLEMYIANEFDRLCVMGDGVERRLPLLRKYVEIITNQKSRHGTTTGTDNYGENVITNVTNVSRDRLDYVISQHYTIYKNVLITDTLPITRTLSAEDPVRDIEYNSSKIHTLLNEYYGLDMGKQREGTINIFLVNFGTPRVEAPWTLFEKQFKLPWTQLYHLFSCYDIHNFKILFKDTSLTHLNFCEACAYLSSDDTVIESEYDIFRGALNLIKKLNMGDSGSNPIIPLIILSCVRYLYMSNERLNDCYKAMATFPLIWKLPLILTFLKSQTKLSINWPKMRSN